MTFRIRLLLSFAAAVILTATLVTWVAAVRTRRALEERDDQRTAALAAQLRREFQRRGQEVADRVQGIAAAEGTLRIAIESSRADADLAPFVNHAQSLAAAHGLDFLELIAHDGTIVSSAQWPARFGYKAAWVPDAPSDSAFLRSEELPEERALALLAVRAVSAGERNLYIAGGQRLDKTFLASLVLPSGMRVLLYRPSPAGLSDASGPASPEQAARLSALIERVRASGREAIETVRWPDGPETFQALPLAGRDQDLLGVLLIGSSRRDLAALSSGIRRIGFAAAAVGVLLGAALSFWAARRITRPVERLAKGARDVAAGDWNARVEVASRDELGQLAEAFNSMTRQLIEQRDKLVQAERVAAWRELARRLAHELKNPLFPLQITIENLQRAREQTPAEFEEVFRESCAMLLAELGNLKKIVGRFSDFAKMPAPQLEAVDVNEVVRKAVQLFDAQLRERPIASRVECGDLGPILADPELLGRALQNLILNAIDAMPRGGTLSIRTARANGTVTLELADTGEGLTPEECERLFTPYYTTKQHGTGLGLAIVQSIVSDHQGRIAVASAPGQGTTFRIELPATS
jgi:signal transduction histidine kinase